MPRPRLTAGRLAALLVGAVYVVMTTVAGGAGALLVSLILAGGSIMFIWFGPEIGEAIALVPNGRRTWSGLILQLGGWLLLAWIFAGFVKKTFG